MARTSPRGGRFRPRLRARRDRRDREQAARRRRVPVSAESQVADAYASGPVLFAYDGSAQAKAAIREAAGQLRRGREAIVLTVWEPPAALAVAGVPVVPPQLEADFEAEAGDVARRGADLARSLGFEATPVVASGEPVWRTIVDTADARDASILVL